MQVANKLGVCSAPPAGTSACQPHFTLSCGSLQQLPAFLWRVCLQRRWLSAGCVSYPDFHLQVALPLSVRSSQCSVCEIPLAASCLLLACTAASVCQGHGRKHGTLSLPSPFDQQTAWRAACRTCRRFVGEQQNRVSHQPLHAATPQGAPAVLRGVGATTTTPSDACYFQFLLGRPASSGTWCSVCGTWRTVQRCSHAASVAGARLTFPPPPPPPPPPPQALVA